MQSGTTSLEKSLTVFYKVKHTGIIIPNHLMPTYLPKTNETNIHIKICMTYNGFIHNHPKLETTQTSIHR